jgi:hypothetical protein
MFCLIYIIKYNIKIRKIKPAVILAGVHPEMALFRNLGVNRQGWLFPPIGRMGLRREAAFYEVIRNE